MKIGVVCYPSYGGSGIVATELGKELANLGHEVHYITYNQPVRLDLMDDNIHFHQVAVPEYPLFKYDPYELALSSKISYVVENYGLDVLHVHYAIPHAYSAYMAKKMLEDRGLSIKIITTLHGTDITLVGRHEFYKQAVEFSINHSDAITAVSKSLRDDTFDIFNIKKDISVVYNFVEVKNYLDVKCNRNCLAKQSEKIIVHTSNFRPVKRTLEVIDIFYGIQKQISSILIMIGDGPELIKAKNRAKKLGVYERIKFLGKTPDLDSFLRNADLFILPSEKESFGLSALEAMAFSTPVVSTNVGGLPEVNIDGVSGFLSDLGDVNSMILDSIKILESDEVLHEFKKNALAQARKFDKKSITNQYLNIYKSIL